MGLAKKCDWFINLTQTETPKYIFLSSRCNDTFVNFMEIFFPKLINKYKLIIASEDWTFPTGNGDARINVYGDRQHLIQKLLDSELLDKIYVENLDTIHPKMKPIPLGLLVFRTKQEIFNIFDDKYLKIDLSGRNTICFCCHRNREGKQWEDRKKVNRLCLNEWKSLVDYHEKLSDDDFQYKLRNSKFCMCVRGGGLDPSPKCVGSSIKWLYSSIKTFYFR